MFSVTDTVPRGSGNRVSPVIEKTSGRPVYSLGARDSNVERFFDGAAYENKTAAYTILPSDMGKLFGFNSSTGFVMSLPSAASVPAGKISFFSVAPPSTNHTIAANGDDLIKTPNSSSSTYTFATSGETITLFSDGVSKWYTVAISSLYTSGSVLFLTDNSLDIGATEANRPRTVYVGNALHVQSGENNGGIFVGADNNESTITNNASKRGTIVCPHYISDTEEYVMMIYANPVTTTSLLNIGGGHTSYNAVTAIQFFTAADAVTLTGTARWDINSTGILRPATDNTYDLGTTSRKVRTLYLGTSLNLPGGTLLTTSAALTDGAAAQTATMTNGPAAGNPTKWIPINDNGTTRYIPAW